MKLLAFTWLRRESPSVRLLDARMNQQAIAMKFDGRSPMHRSSAKDRLSTGGEGKRSLRLAAALHFAEDIGGGFAAIFLRALIGPRRKLAGLFFGGASPYRV